ncbi:MAG: hypothetical protein IIC03_15540, partial [Proteobacteria bacterium]|nr:hypothetical protein [Pseudomonadota bacterium]
MVHLLCVAGFALLGAGLFSISLWDSDYWWHIAAGREIWQSGRVPGQDPFGVFAPGDGLRAQTVLKAQWLGAGRALPCASRRRGRRRGG